MTGSGEAPSLRLFFALWPDDRVRRALDAAAGRLHADYGGRRLRAEALHITLAFLGDVPRARLADLERLAGAIEAEAFCLTVNRLGGWRHSGVAWAAPDRVPAALTQLASRLQDRLKSADFPVDAKRFAPHVTLLRKSHPVPAGLAMEPVEWSVREFVLVSSALSRMGSAYQVIGRGALREVGAGAA